MSAPSSGWTTCVATAFAACSLVLTASSPANPRKEERALALAQLAATAGRFTEGRLYDFPQFAQRRPAAGAELYAAIGQLQMVRDSDPAVLKSESLHARAIAMLAVGRPDAAVSDLQEAVSLGGRSVRRLNDLSVAWLERAIRRRSAQDLVTAFELADEAARLDPRSPDVRFNRALLAERLGLTGQAASRDPEPEAVPPRLDRAADAGDVQALRAIIARHPQECRMHFEDDLLGEWAEMEAGGDAQREQALRRLRAVAAGLLAVTGNPLPSRAVEAIDASRAAPARRAALVRGHAVYRQAIGLYRNLHVNLAEPPLAEAQALLERGGSPFASVALFYRASSRSYDNDLRSALDLLRQTERRAVAEGLAGTPLLGHVQWVRGRALLNRGLPYSSLQCFENALRVFERAGEAESIAALHDLLAWNYEFLGDEERAWAHYVTALQTVGRGNSRRQRIILNDAADYATSHARPHTALLFASALVELARASSNVTDVARSLTDRARALRATGDDGRARADLAEARGLARTVDDRRIRVNLETDIAVAQTEMMPSRDAGAVLASFDAAIAAAERTGRETLLPRLWIERARASVDAGRRAEAERSLRAAIAVIERHRRSVSDPDLQIDFAEEWYRAFDMLVELLAGEERTGEALEYAERSRARVLVEELVRPPASDEAISVRELARELPRDVVVLVYATLGRSSAVWAVRSDSIVCVRLPVTRGGVERMVGAAREAVAKSDSAAERRALGALHEAIVRPIVALLQPADRLVFVPDVALQAVPFAALYDAVRGRWLVEERAVSVAPSMHLFAATLARDRALVRLGRDGILALGDPAFDANRFPSLPRLGGAADEVRRIAALYGRADVLVGAGASRSALLTGAPDFPIVHIAAHALVNARHPSRSALVLAREPGADDGGVLYAFEVDRRAFSSTRLLVLAACGSAAGRPTRYEGPLGLARSFIAAGVPAVVATLWDLDDQAGAALLLRFHQRLRAGDDASAALRAAQVAMIHHPNPRFRQVETWAGLQLIGGFFED